MILLIVVANGYTILTMLGVQVHSIASTLSFYVVPEIPGLFTISMEYHVPKLMPCLIRV